MTVQNLIENLQDRDMPDSEVRTGKHASSEEMVTGVSYYDKDGPVYIETDLERIKSEGKRG